MLKGAQRSEANHEPNEGDLGPVEVEFGPDRSPHALGPRWYRAACCMQGSQRAEPKASTRRFGDPVPMVSDEKHAARRWERTMCRYKAPTVQPWGSPGHPAPVRSPQPSRHLLRGPCGPGGNTWTHLATKATVVSTLVLLAMSLVAGQWGTTPTRQGTVGISPPGTRDPGTWSVPTGHCASRVGKDGGRDGGWPSRPSATGRPAGWCLRGHAARTSVAPGHPCD